MSLKVCWFGIYNRKFPRNEILISGLHINNAEVVECHADWFDKLRYIKLWRSFLSLKGGFDVVYAAYPGNNPTILAKILTRKKVVFDAIYSMYDAVVSDRKEIPWFHPRAIKLWINDWIPALMCDLMIVDTEESALSWTKFPFVKRSKMKIVSVGVQDKVFFPTKINKDRDNFLVSFHGTYIPLQGVDKIVECANILRNEPDIFFRLIGSGQLSDKVNALIEKYNLKNIEQTGRVAVEKVAEYSNQADVILGIFGDTLKGQRAISNKVFEGMALRKPVITMDTPSVREIFGDDELLLIENTPQDMAKAILKLKNDPELRERLAENGYKKVKENYTPKQLGKILLDHISAIR